MNKRLLLISAIAVVVVIVGGLAFWNWFLGSTQTASAPLQPVPLQDSASTSTPAAQVIGPQASATQPAATVAATVSPNNLPVFQISQTDSKAQFAISEVLMGNPNNVVGVTNQVAGQIGVNLNDLSTANIGEIQVDARTLTTDSNMRNRMIQNRILNTGNYEYVTFTPTQISGLSGSAKIGQSFQFQITGNLTIQGVTKPVTFDVTAQAVSNSQISGKATATILRSDYNLQIPNVPQVANVGEQVALEIDFVANAVNSSGN
jgi:polyisoprenoid-binding protein YceI